MLRRRVSSSRREFLQAGAVAMIGAEFAAGRAIASALAQGSLRSNPQVGSSRPPRWPLARGPIHRMSARLSCAVLAVAMSVPALVTPASAQAGDASATGHSSFLYPNSGRLTEGTRDGEQPIVGAALRGWTEPTTTLGASIRRSASPFDHSRMVVGRKTFVAAGTSTRQRSTRRKVIGGVTGAIVGFVGGGLLGGAIDKANCHRDCLLAGLGGFVIGAPIGAVTGGILGAKYF
jgi:hypothetical protein